MLRRTAVSAVFCSNGGTAKLCGVPNNDNIEELILYVKHANKLRQYYGSQLHRCPDREAQYGLMGGPRGGRFTIRRNYSRRQYTHHTANHQKYAIQHTNPKQTYPGTGPYGGFKNSYDNQTHNTNAWWGMSFGRFAESLSKDKAIEWMEDWGVKYKLLDEVSQPRPRDFCYFKHRLYSQNFPWIRDPIVNGEGGDADYQWRGPEEFDYGKEGGAAHGNIANEFRTMWNIPKTPYTKLAKAAKAPKLPASSSAGTAAASSASSTKSSSKGSAKKQAASEQAATTGETAKPSAKQTSSTAATSASSDSKPAAAAKTPEREQPVAGAKAEPQSSSAPASKPEAAPQARTDKPVKEADSNSDKPKSV